MTEAIVIVSVIFLAPFVFLGFGFIIETVTETVKRKKYLKSLR